MKLARIGDKCAGTCFLPGHGRGNPPREVTNAEIISGSNNVLNDEGFARLGDTVNINCGAGHTTKISGASSTVFVNGIAVAREGDAVGTGADFSGTISSGSNNVNSG